MTLFGGTEEEDTEMAQADATGLCGSVCSAVLD